MKQEIFFEKLKSGTFAPILNLLNSSDNFLIVTHPSPDGDCVGSALALNYYLSNFRGKNCCVLTDNKEKFLTIKTKIDSALKNERSERGRKGASVAPDAEKIRLYENLNYQDARLFCLESKNDSESATFVFVDASGFLRCARDFEASFHTALTNKVRYGVEIEKFSFLSAVIDHHPTAGDELTPDASLVDPSSPSAAELVYYLIRGAGGEIDLYLATCLYYAIASDTGFFRFVRSGEGNSTFLVANDLVEAGAMPNIISTALTSGKERAANKYFVALAEGADYVRNGKVVIVCDREEFVKEYGINSRPSDEIYRFFLDTKGVEIVMFLKLTDEPSMTEASIRVSALCDFDASSFARQFGGGGHRAAAGFRTKGSIGEVFNAVKRALTSFKL